MVLRLAFIPIVSLAVAGVSVSPAHAEGVVMQGRLVDCGGSDASVSGDGQSVTFRGACASLTVRGSGNHVMAELVPRARVDVTGDGNVVRYRLYGGTEAARVTVQGTRDVVGPDGAPIAGDAAPASRPALVLTTGAASDADCTDRDVTISGSGGSYTLHGGCRSVTVVGSGTTVHAEMQPQSRISIPGDDDHVLWFLKTSGVQPTTDVTGADSKALQEQRLGSVIAPPSAAPMDTGTQLPLDIAAAPGVVTEDCGGRDVRITGNDATFVLRDRCRTLSLTGNGDTVEAEIQPGSRVTIVGDHSVVQFLIAGAGADPIVSVSGSGSKAYRVQRLGAANRADASAGVTPTAGGMHVQGRVGASVTEMPAVPQPTRPQ